MLMDKMTLLPVILASWWAIGGAAVAIEDRSYLSIGVRNKVFTENLLFVSSARNKRTCALQCSQWEGCVAFTFHGGTCRGHSASLGSCSAFTFAPGARAYTRKTSDQYSAIRCEKTGVKRVISASLGLHTVVYCDDVWMVFQKRQNGRVDFYRNWQNYSTGFGDVHGEYWLGLEALHLITTSAVAYELRVDITLWNGTTASAYFSNILIGSAVEKYSLTFDNYLCGRAGDSLRRPKSKHGFSTVDVDNDSSDTQHCAQKLEGGWWYKDCGKANLNGPYRLPVFRGKKGMFWSDFDGLYSLKSCQMMIKPAN